MRESHRGNWVSIAPAAAFWVATIAYAWRLVDAGVGVVTVVPTVLLPIAATLWTMRAVDWRRRRRQEKTRDTSHISTQD